MKKKKYVKILSMLMAFVMLFSAVGGVVYAEEGDVHEHNKENWVCTFNETEQKLVCGQEEHTHQEICYNENGELNCPLEEHIHTEACYESVGEWDCTAPEPEGEPSSGEPKEEETVPEDDTELPEEVMVPKDDTELPEEVMVPEEVPVTLESSEVDIPAAEKILTEEGGELEEGIYNLTNDLKLKHDLVIPSQKEVTIKLNEYTLEGSGESSVINVEGSLVILGDGEGQEGVITGGNGSMGGGIGCEGSLTLERVRYDFTAPVNSDLTIYAK